MEIICECRNKPLLSQYQIQNLLKTAQKSNIPIAFHDVEHDTQLKFMKENGISICEFPLNFDIAKKLMNKASVILLVLPIL